MAQCDLCGKEGELMTCVIEGSAMSACAKCSTFGQVVRRTSPAPKTTRHVVETKEVIERPLSDFAERVRKLRESRGLTQKDFAKLILEKESVVQKMESQGFVPSLETARKLERQFKISLVEELAAEVSGSKKSSSSSGPITIGDFIKIKS